MTTSCWPKMWQNEIPDDTANGDVSENIDLFLPYEPYWGSIMVRPRMTIWEH